MHFFAYSALAAIPFKLLDAIGAPPFNAFQIVNLAALTILVLALYRFSASVGRTVFATVFFLLSGALLYSNWCRRCCWSRRAWSSMHAATITMP